MCGRLSHGVLSPTTDPIPPTLQISPHTSMSGIARRTILYRARIPCLQCMGTTIDVLRWRPQIEPGTTISPKCHPPTIAARIRMADTKVDLVSKLMLVCASIKVVSISYLIVESQVQPTPLTHTACDSPKSISDFQQVVVSKYKPDAGSPTPGPTTAPIPAPAFSEPCSFSLSDLGSHS